MENIPERQFFNKSFKPRNSLMQSKHVAPKEKIKHCHKTSLWISKGSHIHINQFLQFFPDWLSLTYVDNASPQTCIRNEAGAIYIKNDADVDM